VNSIPFQLLKRPVALILFQYDFPKIVTIVENIGIQRLGEKLNASGQLNSRLVVENQNGNRIVTDPHEQMHISGSF
jgi:hypothetical protein